MGQATRSVGQPVSGGSWTSHTPWTFPPPKPVLAQSRCGEAWVLGGIAVTLDKAPAQPFSASLSHLEMR